MRTKHGNRKVHERVGGKDCHFDSVAEWRYAQWLERLRKAGHLHRWEHHHTVLELHAGYGDNYRVLGTMEPDFTVWHAKDGVVEYHEVKGLATPLWRWKRRHLETEYPGVIYAVIDANGPDGEHWHDFDTRAARKRARKKERAARGR